MSTLTLSSSICLSFFLRFRILQPNQIQSPWPTDRSSSSHPLLQSFLGIHRGLLRLGCLRLQAHLLHSFCYLIDTRAGLGSLLLPLLPVLVPPLMLALGFLLGGGEGFRVHAGHKTRDLLVPPSAILEQPAQGPTTSGSYLDPLVSNFFTSSGGTYPFFTFTSLRQVPSGR